MFCMISTDMSTNKVALVTGSNKGIGFAVVRSLCKNFTGDVYLSARDVGREIFSRRNTAASMYSLTTPVLRSKSPIPRLLESKLRSLRTNFFASRDMCNEFLTIIKPGGRVVNVSSVMSSIALKNCSSELQARFRSSDITEEELVMLMEKFVQEAQNGEHTQKGWPNTAYGVSKIGLTVLSKIQARRLREERTGDQILLNACCPGWVRTDMAGPNATKSPDEGAVTPIYLALLPPGVTEPHGQFVSEKQVQVW
ncbi:hypothetical protein SKAU_G00239520 [Synaphobranchus kaupii]|uniref:Carbonyl reductase 1 n=1 Tax=Synaphobranchus kaupii TaxID=118154 RepID=A0A9Q1F7Q7_SYNKA|nr:hypothetical protein SKAU_G00239520 [Synaphobranchus kaupii]